MKKRHRLLALVLAVSMCMPMTTVSAYADEVAETETVVETEETVAEETETILEQETALDEKVSETETATEGTTNFEESTEETTEDTTVQDLEGYETQDSEIVAEEDEEVLLEADTEGEIRYEVSAPDYIACGEKGYIVARYEESEEFYEESGDCEIESLTIVSQQTTDGSAADVFSFEKYYDEYDEMDKWHLLAEHSGVADIKVVYKTLDGESREGTVRVFAVNENCAVGLYSENDREKAIPGGQITVYTGFYWGGDPASYTYQWEIEDDPENVVSIEANPTDPTRAVVTFNALPEGLEQYEVKAKVRVGEIICGEFVELDTDDITLYETNDFYELFIEGHDPNLPLGETETITAEIRHYSVDFENGYEVVPDATYEWDNVNDQFVITEQSPGSFTVRRMVGYEAGMNLHVACGLDDVTFEEEHYFDYPDLELGKIAFDRFWYDDCELLVDPDKDTVLTYTTENLDGFEDLEIKIEVGGWNEHEIVEPFTEGVDYDVNGQSIILHIPIIRTKVFNLFDVIISAWSGEYEICRDSTSPEIMPIPINVTDIKIADVPYTGKAVKPQVIVKDGSKRLTQGTHYKLKYSDNVNAGTGKVTITGICDWGKQSNYDGSVTKTFAINLGTPAMSSVSNAVGGVKLAWGKINNAEKYRVFRKTGSGKWTKLADTAVLNYTDKTVKSGTKYAYTVRCISADGKKYTSAYDTTGKKITYVAAPVISSITNVNGGVKIVWPKTAGAAKYRIFRKTGSGSWAELADTTAVNYTDKKAANGTTYSYTIRCLNSAGKYASAYNTTGKKITYVARPTISSLTSAKTKQMLVKWGKNAKATGYIIQYSTSSKFASGNKTVTVKGAAAVSKTITNLTAKKKYYVRVRTYKAVGGKNYYSAWSAAKNVTTK